MHLLAAACWLSLTLPEWALAAGLPLFLLSLTYHLRQARRLPFAALRLEREGALSVIEPAGEAVEAQLLPDFVAHPWLVVLRLRVEGRRYALTLPPDALEKDAHRQLRVWLNWRAKII